MDQNINAKKAKLRAKLYTGLSLREIVLWTSIWIFSVGYSMYHVYNASRRFWRYMAVQDFEKGFIGTYRKDVSDSEWATFSTNLFHTLPWLTLHFIGTQFFQRQNETRFLTIFHAAWPLLFVYSELGGGPLLLLLAQPFVLFVVAEIFGKAFFVWGGAIAIIALNDHLVIKSFKEWAFEDSSFHTKYITHVIMFWINSRCVSFCLDHIWKEVHEESRLWKWVQLIGFCFYLPIGIQGPLINYLDYKRGLYGKAQEWNLERIKKLLLLLVRYIFWYFFIEAFLHFFYVSAFKYEKSIVATFDMWTLAGLGFTIGQFFHLKYVFFYGISRPFLLADGIQPPNHPKCIARIHLYSDMWRYFDEGLHKFMHRYIYLPVMNVLGHSRNLFMQLIAAIICFSFVYLWHGIMPHVFTWSALNFIGILVEKLASAIWHNESYQRMEKYLLSARGQRRLHAALSAPLFMMSICSNMYFLLGDEIGPLFLNKALTSWPLGTPTTLFFLYCGAQTSIEIKNWEVNRAITALSQHQHVL